MAEPERESRSDNVDDDAVSEAGDIGDRSLRRSNTPRILSLDYLVEAGSINDETATPQENENRQKTGTAHFILDYISCMMFLALFGILGVIARFGLHILFGHRGMAYPDLASNMVGSFLMGWFGVVFRPSISRFSDNLAIGLTTGFLGSLTTFSGWNQTLVKLSIERGQWVSAFCTAVVGLCLSASMIYFGVQTANGGKKWLIRKCSFDHRRCRWNLNKCLSTLLLTLLLSGIWSVLIYFAVEYIKTGRSDYVTEFILACAVGPFGVWTRWALARCNGHGFGKKGRLRWVPFGTLVANVVASVLMAGLAVVRNAVDVHGGKVVATGAQIGFCGCLSTVSAFIAEFYAMNESSHPWRAYAYAFTTIIISFGLGILVYSVPVWVNIYE